MVWDTKFFKMNIDFVYLKRIFLIVKNSQTYKILQKSLRNFRINDKMAGMHTTSREFVSTHTWNRALLSQVRNRNKKKNIKMLPLTYGIQKVENGSAIWHLVRKILCKFETDRCDLWRFPAQFSEWKRNVFPGCIVFECHWPRYR